MFVVQSPKISLKRNSGAQGRALIPCLVGAFLLFASVLKGYDLATIPTVETTLWTSRWFLIALAEVEFALGLWLISGLLSSFARWTALGAFLAFFGVSISKALAGEASCGCFGAVVQMSPRFTAIMDLAVIVALFRWRPPADSLPKQHRNIVRVSVTGLIACS
jgi:hypothetical protein